MLAGRYYDVILNGFGRPEEIQSSLEECKKLSAKLVEHHGADLSDPSQIEACFKYIEDKYGKGPDVLVNNAGEFFVIRCTYSHTLSLSLTHSHLYPPHTHTHRNPVCISD